MDYEIKYIGEVTGMHHLNISHNGSSYTVIFGRYIKGGFCCIPNHNAECELSADPKDKFWNTESLARALESLARALKSKKAAAAIAEAIAVYAEVAEQMEK